LEDVGKVGHRGICRDSGIAAGADKEREVEGLRIVLANLR